MVCTLLATIRRPGWLQLLLVEPGSPGWKITVHGGVVTQAVPSVLASESYVARTADNRRELDVDRASADRADLEQEPGELIRLVAGGLIANGFDIRPTDYERGCTLILDWRGAQCTLSVSDWGNVEWECRQWPGGEADPKRVADVATTFLTGDAADYPRLGAGYGHCGMTFKGVVGLELKARGLDVTMEIYQDERYFDAQAEIVATNSQAKNDATIYVTDDGNLTWERNYWDEAPVYTRGPGSCELTANPGKVADVIVETVTLAMSCI